MIRLGCWMVVFQPGHSLRRVGYLAPADAWAHPCEERRQELHQHRTMVGGKHQGRSCRPDEGRMGLWLGLDALLLRVDETLDQPAPAPGLRHCAS
jgi:hypothetical protein